MCGVLGIAVPRPRSVDLSDIQVERMRDALSHRGPDGSGLWRSVERHVALAHRRLAVIDLSAAAAQPMVSADGRFAISYNGELYNDADVRRELAGRGVTFRTSSDTETVLLALATWGAEALLSLRGMFAFAFYNADSDSLLLARDPLGIKPLYYCVRELPAQGDDAGDAIELTFASEPTAILRHPQIPTKPDLAAISAYLTTIRTTMGDRTLYAGIRTLRPGQAMVMKLGARIAGAGAGGAGPSRIAVFDYWASGPVREVARSDEAMRSAVAGVREALAQSVGLHLRADVPTCSLLSGGIDSTVIAMLARRGGQGSQPVRTYCSGHDDGAGDSDLAFARRAAAGLGTIHTEAPITKEMFLTRWPEMVERLGTPLSTPNEVAINEVARRLRADGQVVAFSGEGADELLAGYELPMRRAMEWETTHGDGTGAAGGGGVFQLLSNAWIQPQAKDGGGTGGVLNPDVWRAVEHDSRLIGAYEDEFAMLRAQAGAISDGGAAPLDAHLRFHRRINLAGLLQRLDTATMLESVEGRTPFADVVFAGLAESLPMWMKFEPAPEPAAGSVSGVAPAWRAVGTKLVLRGAFERDVPAEILSRPKASFPLPFQSWIVDAMPMLSQSEFARALFTPAAIRTVQENPVQLWNLAWPMLNMALWGRRW